MSTQILTTLSTKSRAELLQLTKKFIPPLLPTYYKGQCGKIVIIGGCEDYTGAPYFSAHATAQLGCDLTHVICELGAGTVIKSYSPDLMVHPYLRDSRFLQNKINNKGWSEREFLRDEVLPKVNSILDKVQVVVVGPGFGRDELMLLSLELILKEIKKRNLPVVLDADALYLLSLKPELIKGYSNAILTPNLIEFKRIYDSVFNHANVNSNTQFQQEKSESELIKKVQSLSNYFNCAILHKGAKDIIVYQDEILINDDQGSNKRVGDLARC
ncbi:unnamed protein product [Ambrosiozyma monospora]|uniref:ATP-dependent (S)-NAD(P)H-hydrate dehydratase n=1 Tax=Ambrosiozyma monospora TaxID=43982 RepID=A0A9W6YZP8_AMBMO|nr:unnamed protein product [Ambrosiozyma monospora]